MSANAPFATLFAVDGLTPSSIIEPSSVEELAAALRDANERGAAVIPRGAGRHMSLGNVPARYDVALRTTRLDRVIEYEPADMTITIESGITMGSLQALLAEHGQFLPIDAPAEAKVGGVLAAGVSGPSRHAYGLPRDWLIGCRIVLADGTIVKGGGRVVKNVAGYDIPKLIVGSLGTLGIIAEATFKLAPLPAAQETLVARCGSGGEAARLVFAADERSLALRSAALRLVQGTSTVGFWLAGPPAAIERTRRELTGVCAGAETELLQGDASRRWWAQLDGRDAAAGDSTVLRASLLPSRVAAFLAQLPEASEALAYPTTGLVLVRLDASLVEVAVALVDGFRRWAADAGESVIVTSAPVEVKQRLDAWGQVEGLAVMRALKQQFDPKSTLNPGRFVGGT